MNHGCINLTKYESKTLQKLIKIPSLKNSTYKLYVTLTFLNMFLTHFVINCLDFGNCTPLLTRCFCWFTLLRPFLGPGRWEGGILDSCLRKLILPSPLQSCCLLLIVPDLLPLLSPRSLPLGRLWTVLCTLFVLTLWVWDFAPVSWSIWSSVWFFSSVNPHTWSHIVTIWSTAQAFIIQPKSRGLQPHDLLPDPTSTHVQNLWTRWIALLCSVNVHATSYQCRPWATRITSPSKYLFTDYHGVLLIPSSATLLLSSSCLIPQQQKHAFHGVGPPHKAIYWRLKEISYLEVQEWIVSPHYTRCLKTKN